MAPKRGSENKTTVLTERQEKSFAIMYADLQYSVKAIAYRFGMCESHVSVYAKKLNLPIRKGRTKNGGF